MAGTGMDSALRLRRRLVLGGGGLVLGGAAAPAVPSAMDLLAPTGTLRGAFLGTNAVQGVVDRQTHGVTGVVAEITRGMAAALGVASDIYPAANAADIVHRLESGQADIGFMAYDPERAGELDFSQAYAVMLNTLVVPASSTVQASGELDRAGLMLAAVRGQTQQIVLSRTVRAARVRVLDRKPTQAEVEAMLASHEIDAYAGNRHDMETIATASRGALRALADNFMSVDQEVVVRKGTPGKIEAVNRLLSGLRDSGLVADALLRQGIGGVVVARTD